MQVIIIVISYNNKIHIVLPLCRLMALHPVDSCILALHTDVLLHTIFGILNFFDSNVTHESFEDDRTISVHEFNLVYWTPMISDR